MCLHLYYNILGVYLSKVWCRCAHVQKSISTSTHSCSQDFVLLRPRLSTENLMLVRGMGRVFLKLQVMVRGWLTLLVLGIC